jgi:predicted nucleic acid-binding protein
MPPVTRTPVPSDMAVKLAALRVETGLKMPDCCVLLTAEGAGGRLATFDERLARAARNRDLEVFPA